MRTTLTTHDGLTLHVRRHGRPDAELTVVLVHCWTGDQDMWRYQVASLQAEFGHEVQVISYDHRGHGESDAAGHDACTVDHLAADLAKVIDELVPTGRIILAGHSIGGMTIMALAEQRPDLLMLVAGTVLVSTSAGDLDTVTRGLPGLVGRRVQDALPYLLAARSRTLTKAARRRSPLIETQIVRRLLFGEPRRMRDQALTIECLVNVPAATMTGFFEDVTRRHDRYDVLPALAVAPVHVLVGDRDQLTPPAHAQRLASSIPGARLTIAPGAGHMLNLERDELVTAAIADLVRQAHAAPAASWTTAPRLAIAR